MHAKVVEEPRDSGGHDQDSPWSPPGSDLPCHAHDVGGRTRIGGHAAVAAVSLEKTEKVGAAQRSPQCEGLAHTVAGRCGGKIGPDTLSVSTPLESQRENEVLEPTREPQAPSWLG